MAERGMWWIGRTLASAAAGLAVSLLSVQSQKQLPAPDGEGAEPDGAAEEEGGLPPLVERALRGLGQRGGQVHERTEQVYAMYKLLKALGLSDADIARLVVQKAGEKVDAGLEGVRPTDARVAFEAMENAAVRAASEVDARMDLGGDLVRRVRDGAVAVRAGREDALVGLERGLTAGRTQLRRWLAGSNRDEDAE